MGAPNTQETRYVRRRRQKRRRLFWLLILIAACAVGCRFIKDGRFAPRPVPAPEQNVQADFSPEWEALEAQLGSASGNFVVSDADRAELEDVAARYPAYAEQICLFLAHIDVYSQTAVNNVLVSPEKIDFVLVEPFTAEPEGEQAAVTAKKGEVPFLLQYDARWGFHPYGSSCIGYTGCGPTCLSMAVMGLTGDAAVTPDVVSDFAEANGYYVPGSGTSWSLFTDGAANFGLHGWTIATDEDTMRDCLQRGGVLVASMLPGDFTRVGHFIVLTDCGMHGFRVYDPNCVERSQRWWSFDELAGQIAQLWCLAA